jgi:hypothetical protein
MSERASAIDDATLKCGLLMESAQAHQRLAESQIEKLRAHTQDLDSVVRDEIRRTLIEELQMLTTETTRATQALQRVKRAASLRSALVSLVCALLCALIPMVIARWILPSTAEISALRARRDALASNVANLEQQGGRIDWRRCGDAKRICVRVDRKAPIYGDAADYYVIEGY